MVFPTAKGFQRLALAPDLAPARSFLLAQSKDRADLEVAWRCAARGVTPGLVLALAMVQGRPIAGCVEQLLGEAPTQWKMATPWKKG
jgi:non-ribosomal peptide synthetase component F